ncbi:hypothetical protein Dxin01_00196 [Deinococcus xinjiangensis]|uniref:Uncharacterized protein n=1 Tax=Deinococcus xinjiangensis TaxID=457454 RepID=A0ABP9V5A8_9DEIO
MSHYTSAKLTAPQLVTLGHAIEKLLGRVPARDDLRPVNRKTLEDRMGVKIPSERAFVEAFGSWGEFLTACGWAVEGGRGRQNQLIERAAVEHCVAALGVTEESAEQSITDGWLPDGRTVEIKGSVLRRHTLGYEFFSFRLHHRDLSLSADELLLVGLSRDLKPIVRIEVPKSAMQQVIDGKSSVTLYADAVWGSGDSKFRRFVKWRESGGMAQVPHWSAGLPGAEK